MALATEETLNPQPSTINKLLPPLKHRRNTAYSNPPNGVAALVAKVKLFFRVGLHLSHPAC